MISSISIFKTVIAVWLIIAWFFCSRVPCDRFTNDFGGHLQYTEIIANSHRLPYLYEGQETFQPPLYYLINSLAAPKPIEGDKTLHVNVVRGLSVLYGAVSLLIIAWLIKQTTQNIKAQVLTLLFIATTPMFILTFTSYNNDALLTLLSISTLVLSYGLNKKWSSKLAVTLLLVSVAALYTKLTGVIAILAVLLYCSASLFREKPFTKNKLKIVCILILSITLFLPWIIFNNYKNYKVLFPVCPTYALEQPNRKVDVVQLKNLAGIVFRIPKLQNRKVDYSHEWDEPWLYTHWYNIHPSTKRYDYFAASFVTSIIGESIFYKPPTIFIWAMFWIHLLVYLIALGQIFRMHITKLSAFVICFCHLFQILTILLFPEQPHRAMGYRYICWSWLAWAVLYTRALSNKSRLSVILEWLMKIGILDQIYILATMEGGIS